MNCQQIDKYMYEFCDRRLSPQMQDSIQSHLDQCQNCREKVTAACQEGGLLRDLDNIPVLSPEFTHQVLARVQQKHGMATAGIMASHASRYPRPFRWWWGVASAAVLLVALCSVPLLELQSPPGSKLAGQDSAGSAPVETAPLMFDGSQTTQDSSSQPPQASFILESTEASPKTVLQDSPVAVKGMDALPQKLPQPAPTAQPYTSTALSDQTLKSAAHNNPNRGAELLTLHPVNLPPEYTLRAIISASDQDTTFVYRNQLTQQDLNLRITVVTDMEKANQADVEQPLMRSVAPLRNDGLGGSAPLESGVPDRTFKAVVDHNQQSYQIVLSGSLKVEELAAIASSIKFEEGNQVAKTEIP